MEKNRSERPRSTCRDGCFSVCDYSLAMVYSPDEEFEKLYSPIDALAHGTLFESLWLPIETAGKWEVKPL